LQELDDEQVEETLQSLGIDIDELAQRAQDIKHHPFGLDGIDEDSEVELPWGGFSDESEVEEVHLPRRRTVNRTVSA
jgi:hypothetical protein